ncbi:hypothetical protein [Myroides injenensis]|uniref:hypothetical protein n=1 Tax=Myroides injenensis TaxID=1183151 RepID=UPI0002E487D6|nr:hypothetical protein [Myroides injenensis]
MKKIVCVVLVMAVFFGCKEKREEVIEEINNIENTVNSKSIEVLTSELLLPLEIVKEGSEDVLTKYGLDFSGNCYACDVANLLIDGEMITLMNACDIQTQLSFKILSIEENENKIIVKTPINEFMFIRINELPLYELHYKGEPLDHELYRLGSFYTIKSKLASFEVHDCGDFEG